LTAENYEIKTNFGEIMLISHSCALLTSHDIEKKKRSRSVELIQ